MTPDEIIDVIAEPAPTVEAEAVNKIAEKREDYLEVKEARARRLLEEQSRRWPTNPNTFYVLLIAVLLVILLLAL